MHVLPGEFAAAVAATKPFPPEFDDTRPELRQRRCIAGNPVICEVSAKLLTQCVLLESQARDADLFDTIARLPLTRDIAGSWMSRVSPPRNPAESGPNSE